MEKTLIELCRMANLSKEQALQAMEYLIMLRSTRQRKELTALIEKEYRK
jgi:hypothetical protein